MKTYHHHLPSLITEKNSLGDTLNYHSTHRMPLFLCPSDSAVFWITRGSLTFWNKMPQDLKTGLGGFSGFI